MFDYSGLADSLINGDQMNETVMGSNTGHSTYQKYFLLSVTTTF